MTAISLLQTFEAVGRSTGTDWLLTFVGAQPAPASDLEGSSSVSSSGRSCVEISLRPMWIDEEIS